MTTNSPVGGPQGRVPLVSALAFVGVLIAQAILIAGAQAIVIPGMPDPGNLALSVLFGLIQIVPFGIGVFVALRYVVPIRAADAWALTVIRSVVVGLFGAVVLAVVSIAIAFANLTVAGGFNSYSITAGAIDTGDLFNQLAMALVSTFASFLQWMALVLVVCVFQKLWLASRAAKSATASVSGVGKL